MSELRFRTSLRAEQDIQQIYNWLAERSALGAAAWYAVLRQVVASIARNPRSYGPARESYRLRRPLREAIVRTKRGRAFRAVFLVKEDEVILVRVRSADQSALGMSDLDDS
jgi:plasmid stabilization system protein ParE